jgi:DNA-binding GntR family transcriptional regulator
LDYFYKNRSVGFMLTQQITATRKAGLREILSTEDIYERIMAAIMAHRMPPGTQLKEDRLAKAFNVSRTKVRQAINRLAQDQVVTLIAHRGAFISSPSIQQAREVLEARRMLEPELIRRAVRLVSSEHLRQLYGHVEKEAAARAARNRRAVVTLTGEFHQMLAEIAGNTLVARLIRELEVLTALVIILYEAPSVSACPEGEHAMLVKALESGDEATAAQLMLEHIDHVEAALDLRAQTGDEIDLERVFGEMI